MAHRNVELALIAVCAACGGAKATAPAAHADTATPVPAEADVPDAGETGAPHASSIKPGMPTVGAGLQAEAVRRFAMRALPRFRACSEDGLRRNPALHGHIDVTFAIDADGKVASAAQAPTTTLPDAAVVACVVGVVSVLLFPRPTTAPVTVELPFELGP
ncbi:MAG TPA: AgmX/PglI C-terminal domain-containing protein [Polyangiaceae bacterium]|nr:AgmX/PglI C-terminal domain-containing protein [Polyangiaceae bacterium]